MKTSSSPVYHRNGIELRRSGISLAIYDSTVSIAINIACKWKAKAIRYSYGTYKNPYFNDIAAGRAGADIIEKYRIM